MKKIINIAIILALSIIDVSNIYCQENANDYCIKKTKSKKDWYIIYAERNDSIFKIVSEKIKNQAKTCNKLVVGQYYNLILISNIPEVNGIKLIPINYLDVKTIFSPGQSVYSIEPEKGIFDTFHSDNIEGRCFRNK